jgi:hypothetical protein
VYTPSLGSCPWCARTSAGFPELFPPGVDGQQRTGRGAVRVLAFALLVMLVIAVAAAVVAALLAN